MKKQENDTTEVILDSVKLAALVAGAVVIVWCFVDSYRKAPPPEREPSRERYVFEEPQDWADDTTKTLGKVLYLRSVYETKDCAESE